METAPLRAVLESLRPQVDDVIGTFYERLLETRPDFAPHFASTDWPRQRRMLLSSLVLMLECQEDPDQCLYETMRGFGRRHGSYELSEGDYRLFGTILRDTLAGFAGEAWTPDVELVWEHSFGNAVKLMRG